jgi:hypothetical protein
MRQRYLVLFEHGPGRGYGYVLAEDADAIRRAFPELRLVEELPSWLTGDRLARLEEQVDDLDAPRPSGLLSLVLQARAAAERPSALIAVDPAGAAEPIVERLAGAPEAIERQPALQASLEAQGLGHLQLTLVQAATETELEAMIAAKIEQTAQRARARTGILRCELYWKCESGAAGAAGADAADVGPAWLHTFDGEELVGSERIRRGAWITRAEARQVADERGITLSEDG